MKKIACLLLSVGMFFAVTFSFMTPVKAETTELGTRLKTSNTFYLYKSSEKTLYINGWGDTPNLSNSSASIPWLEWPSGTIQRVVVSEGITSLGNYLLYNVSAGEVILPSTLKRIGKYALSCNNGMTKWELPFGLETIDNYAFYATSAMTEISLPNSLKTIGMRAFAFCTGLKSVEIPPSVTRIDSYAFHRCINLESVEFTSLTQSVEIGLSAFIDCPLLKSVSIPENALCSAESFGYINSTTKVEDFSLRVFYNSTGYTYALANQIPYTLIDEIQIKCGVEYKDGFDESNLNDAKIYTIIPERTQEYVIYTNGECDTYAELYYNGELIAQSDDIDVSNRGFCISAELVEGQEYTLNVKTVKMAAEYTLMMYPKSITSFDVVSGGITASAADGKVRDGVRVYTLNNDMLDGFVFDVSFEDGSIYRMYYTRYIAGEYVSFVDAQKESPFTCGENTAYLSLGENTADYKFTVEHSYEFETIAPTEDEDGYDLFTCISCGDTYKDNYVPTTAFSVTGLCVMDENNFGRHDYNVPYNNAYITVDGRTYNINDDGTFEIHTFENCWAVIHNNYGGNVTLKIDVSNGSYDYGIVTLEPYDLNKDGVVNAKDYALYYKYNYERLGEDYWRFAENYYLLR